MTNATIALIVSAGVVATVWGAAVLLATHIRRQQQDAEGG